MAQTTISITIIDSPQAPLSDIRDTLCVQWNYPGDPADNVAKLTFLKATLMTYIRQQYLLGKEAINQASVVAAQTAATSSAITAANSATIQ